MKKDLRNLVYDMKFYVHDGHASVVTTATNIFGGPCEQWVVTLLERVKVSPDGHEYDDLEVRYPSDRHEEILSEYI